MAGVQTGSHDDRQAYWDEDWFIDDVVVKLRRCSSQAFLLPTVRLSDLFFLDDAKIFDNNMDMLGVKPHFPCTDMGRYTIANEQVEAHSLMLMMDHIGVGVLSSRLFFSIEIHADAWDIRWQIFAMVVINILA